MAAKYRPFSTAFWGKDKYILDLSIEERYFYIYLLTNEHTSFCGIYILSQELIAFETKIPLVKVKKLIKKFTNDGKIVYSNLTGEVCICNWLKHNCNNNDKQKKGISNSLALVKDKTLIGYLKNKDEILQGI